MPQFVHQLPLLLLSKSLVIVEALSVTTTVWLEAYQYYASWYGCLWLSSIRYICSNSHTFPSLGSWILDNEYCHVIVAFSTPLEDPIRNLLLSVNCVKFRTACGLRVDSCTSGSYRVEDDGNEPQFDVKQYVISGQLLSSGKWYDSPMIGWWRAPIWNTGKHMGRGEVSGEICSC